MNLTAPGPVDPHLEVHKARASSVIVQRVPASAAKAFMEWQDGVTAATAVFPGYQTTEIYPPASDQQRDWVIVVHFNDVKSLQAWLDSPQRAECLAKAPEAVRDFRLKVLPSGLDFWFGGWSIAGKRPPHWKVFLSVLLGIYPIVMLISMFLLPHYQQFGLPIAALIGNVLSVACLEWLGMPVINRILGRWVHANDQAGKRYTLIGLGLILGTLGLMVFLFHLMTHQPSPTP